MDRRAKWVAGGVLAFAVISAGTSIAMAAGVGDDDRPLTGSTLDKATTAALELTGGGTVIETEVGDEGAAYGVEIRLDDGSVVEVGLDEDFAVIGQEGDAPDEREGSDED